MKKVITIFGAFYFLLIFVGCSGDKKQQEVKIGDQTWMSSNLNVDKFMNGDPIPELKTEQDWKDADKNKTPGFSYYRNNVENGKTYGKLYNWYAVNDSRGIAPAGWHVPSKADWKKLIDFLGGEETAGKKIKSTAGWTNTEGGINGTNESGFNALPGGYCTRGYFFNLNEYSGTWWTSSEHSEIFAFTYELKYDKDKLTLLEGGKGNGFSVRCIKD